MCALQLTDMVCRVVPNVKGTLPAIIIRLSHFQAFVKNDLLNIETKIGKVILFFECQTSYFDLNAWTFGYK